MEKTCFMWKYRKPCKWSHDANIYSSSHRTQVWHYSWKPCVCGVQAVAWLCLSPNISKYLSSRQFRYMTLHKQHKISCLFLIGINAVIFITIQTSVGLEQTHKLIIQVNLNSQNLKDGKIVSLYHNIPFMFKCFHIAKRLWLKKYCETTRPESHQTAKMVFLCLYFFFFFFFFRWAS